MSEVAGMLADLKAGKVTLDEVASKFKSVKWGAPRKAAEGDAFWAAQADDPVPDEGPALDLMNAYYGGVVTDEQYAALYAALPGGGGSVETSPAAAPAAAPVAKAAPPSV